MKTDRELRIKSAEQTFTSIVEHSKMVIENNMYLSIETLLESEYGFIVDACVRDIMRKLDISTSCDLCFDVVNEYLIDAISGYDCNFKDMCIALIEGR